MIAVIAAIGSAKKRPRYEKLTYHLGSPATTPYPALSRSLRYRTIGPGDKGGAFHWLEEGCDLGDEWLVYLRIYPEFAPLRSDRRFQELERKVGIGGSR